MSKKIQNSSSSNAVLNAILNHDKTSANSLKLEEMKAERDEFRRRYEDECYENKVLTRKNDKLQIEVQKHRAKILEIAHDSKRTRQKYQSLMQKYTELLRELRFLTECSEKSTQDEDE